MSLNEHLEHDDGEASMVTHEYRVTEAADGTFPVELWSSQGYRSQLIYKTRGFQSRELAEAWIVPVEDRSGDPPSALPRDLSQAAKLHLQSIAPISSCAS